VPAAPASIKTRPIPSFSEVGTNTSMADIGSGTSSRAEQLKRAAHISRLYAQFAGRRAPNGRGNRPSRYACARSRRVLRETAA
jgi:hypothetical protein